MSQVFGTMQAVDRDAAGQTRARYGMERHSLRDILCAISPGRRLVSSDTPWHRV
jgi:hypothetical protein